MILLEKQVVNLELSKRLKELGVKQESYREWSEADARARMLVWLLEKMKPQRRGLPGLHRVPVWDQSHR